MLLPYHLRLAALSLRRNWVISLVMLLALAMGNATWTVAVTQWVRFQPYETHLAPSLHQVETVRPRDANAFFADGAADPYLAPAAIMARTQQSWTEARLLATSPVPARQSLGARAEVLVRGDGEATVRMARFTDPAFFPMFERPFATGGPWSAADEAAGAAVCVLGFATGRALFPKGDGVGRAVAIEGRPFQVVGVLGARQPLNAPWQLLISGGYEDALFLPLPELERLGVTPDQPVTQSPYGAGRAALLASDARFVTSWVELPTPGHVASYRAELDRLVGPGNWVLRALHEWRRDLAMPTSQISFFSVLGLIGLVAGAANLARCLLTKGLVRAEELGVYRALGAPRASIFARTFSEGMLIALPAALLGPLVAQPTFWLFNTYVRVVDMPLELTRLAFVASVVPPLVGCVVASTVPAWLLARTKPTLVLGSAR